MTIVFLLKNFTLGSLVFPKNSAPLYTLRVEGSLANKSLSYYQKIKSFFDCAILDKAMTQKLTPMMQQWQQCKEQAGDCLLLFRLGEFYEAFFDDALVLAQNLDITLTQRQNVPMSGIPAANLDGYVDRLVSRGFKVAIAEQADHVEGGKGLVPRTISRLITPGALLSSSLLPEKANNYIVAINQVGSLYGLSCLDLSTGAFLVAEYDNTKDLIEAICRLAPSELLSHAKFYQKNEAVIKQLQQHLRITLSEYASWAFEYQSATKKLYSCFQVSSLDGFGLQGLVPAINAAGALLSYIQDKLLLPISHLSIPKIYGQHKHLLIDKASQTNLELLSAIHGEHGKGSLLQVMERTSTPMGGRLLRNTLINPFYDLKEITLRQDSVEFFLQQEALRKQVKRHLSCVRDLERLATKISTTLASPKDIGMLRDSLLACSHIANDLQNCTLPEFLSNKFLISQPLRSLIETLSTELFEELPLKVSDGNIFVDHHHQDLLRLRNLKENSKSWILEYQDRIRQETGIKKLKVCYAQALGYYIEVASNLAPQLPKEFIRRQSRLHAERFTTQELQQFQDEVFSVEDKLQSLETQLFKELCFYILQQRDLILELSAAIADLDYVTSLAELAAEYDYRRPLVDHSDALSITKGMHPVALTLLDRGTFIPNDTVMHSAQTRMILLTGPNMAGKSTYIRQIALLVIMAQMGSFIPARSAHIGIIDKIFTRIGAGDNLSKGMSTFMVEMAETANILHNATDRSLVILDEIGRGTSTYDGLAIAQAVVEFLLFTDGKKAKTLFATHYKELTELEMHCQHVENFHAVVKENGGQPIFMYEIAKGHSKKSFGIHVAKLAGFPLSVVSRAQQILYQFEGPDLRPEPEKAQQLIMF